MMQFVFTIVEKFAPFVYRDLMDGGYEWIQTAKKPGEVTIAIWTRKDKDFYSGLSNLLVEEKVFDVHVAYLKNE